ncbi:hypothetical protein [Vulcanisaeta moutnovskia]|uniref:hypothetical protein n=1 Tax=Vulcanisaeta moutnovskia TaxID=985052 RepID=UPI0011D12ACA|nr:hypothetical protein [Vulcanisaeta moutnovskia]
MPMVNIERRKLLESLFMAGSVTALLGALPEIVRAYSPSNIIIDPRSIGNMQTIPSKCDVHVQPPKSPTGQSQPMVVAADGTVIVDSSGTIVNSLGCWSTYTNYAKSSYSSFTCPGGQTLTSGIQEAINYIINTKGSAGGVVCIAPGTYYVTSIYSTAISNSVGLVLEGLGNIAFVGSGMDKTIIQFQRVQYLPYFFDLYNASNITVRDLTLLAYDTNNNPGQGMFLANTDGLLIENVHYKGNAILNTGQYPWASCPSTGCSGGLTNTFNFGKPNTNIVLRGSILELSHAQFNLRFTQNVLIEDNIFRYSVGDHLIISYNNIPQEQWIPVTNVVIRNNKLLWAGDTAIDFISLHGGHVIEGNYIETAGNAILLFSQVETDLVINNVIKQVTGAENGITTGFEATANPGALIMNNRLYNSPAIIGRYIINNYCENCGGIYTYPGTGEDWFIFGNTLKNTPFGIRCGGLYTVNGCTGVVANNRLYMYGPAGPMSSSIFDFRGPIHDTLIANNYIEGPPLSTSLPGGLGCSGYYMPYGINLGIHSASVNNVITGNTILNAKCAYPLEGKVDPCMCGFSGMSSACGTAWLPIVVASPNNYIFGNTAYATGGQYNYGNLYPIPPGILKLLLTPGTPVQNPYPFDTELDIPISATSTPANVQVYIGPSQSQLTLAIQRQYSSTGIDTISIKLPAGWWIQVNTTNTAIGTPVVVGL